MFSYFFLLFFLLIFITGTLLLQEPQRQPTTPVAATAVAPAVAPAPAASTAVAPAPAPAPASAPAPATAVALAATAAAAAGGGARDVMRLEPLVCFISYLYFNTLMFILALGTIAMTAPPAPVPPAAQQQQGLETRRVSSPW